MDGAAGIFGVAFFFSDGSEDLCGSKTTTQELGRTIPCIEQSFLLNGPDGERITGVEYSTGTSPHTGNPCIAILKV
jgi:hypothetical protein